MSGMSFEAKVGLAVIGALCVVVVWLTLSHRRGASPIPPRQAANRAASLKDRLARLRASEAFVNRQRALKMQQMRDRSLPTPPLAVQQQIAGAARRSHKLGELATDADLDFNTLKKMALVDGDPDNRIVAVWLLGSMDDKPVMPVLEKALSDPDPEVRMAALESISEFDNPPVKALAKALDDTDPEIRFEALSVAAELDDKTVQPLLVKALDDPDADVRSLAQGLADTDTPVRKARPAVKVPAR
jgi:HEAT repeats